MKMNWLYFLLLPFLFLSSFFYQAKTIQAAEVGNVITRIYVTDANGNELIGDIRQWQTFRLNADFTLPDSQVKAGDTTRVKIPNEIEFLAPFAFSVTDAEGNIVANGVADPNTKTLTLTYTNYVETHSGVSGNFYFNVRVDTNKVTTRTEITLNIDVEGKVISAGNVTFTGIGPIENTKAIKSAWQNSTDPQLIEYSIAINRSTDAKAMTQVVISDVLRNPSLSYVPESFRIYTGTWVPANGDWTLSNSKDVTADYQVQINGSRFTLDLGDIPQGTGINIRYRARVPYIPTSGEEFYNDVRMTSLQDEVITRTSRYTFYSAGGQAQGYVYTIQVNKVNEAGESLSGAVFDVIRVRSGATVGQITTDASGKGTLGSLLNDEYILREVTPPTGYSLGEDVIVKTSDFDQVSRIANKNVVNKKIITTTTVEPSTTITSTTTVEPSTTITSTTTVEPSTTATTTTTVEPSTTATTTTTVEPSTTTTSTTTVEPSTTATTTTTVEPSTTATTTTTVEPSTTPTPTTTVEPTTTTTAATTSIQVPKTTGDIPSPPKPGTKSKVLPRTGEESGLVTSLVGLTLLIVAGLASFIYRKSKNVEKVK